MKISAQFSFWMGIVFALLTAAMALSNLVGADANATEAELEFARGYAIFWLFLSAFGVGMVVLSWLMLKGKLGNLD
jgi:undecaprenyl pyrophosphate phosphatase UppP